MDRKYLDFLGITKWHSEGYKGKNIKFLSEEKISQNAYNNVICPFGFGKKAEHGNTTMKLMQEVAPEATFFALTISGIEKAGDFQSEEIDYIKENNIDVITTSSLGQALNGIGARKALQELVSRDVVLVCSAGNQGHKGLDDMAKNEEWLAIGGCYYNNGKPKVAGYSAVGEELDFVSLMGGLEGTSFAAPIFAAMLVLVQGFFLEKIGRKLHYAELIDFVKKNCIDLYEEGFDNHSGYGMFILPNPDSINLNKYYTEVKEMKTNIGLVEYVKSKLGCPYVWGKIGQFVDGKQCFDCAGLIKGYYFNMDHTPNSYNAAEDYSADKLLQVATEKGSIDTLPLNTIGLLVHMKGHVGVYIGNSKVIEARGKAYGVVETNLKDRPWTSWSKCPWFEYKEEKQMGEKITDVNVAVDIIAEEKILNDTNYWKIAGNYQKNVNQLLLNMANYIKNK